LIIELPYYPDGHDLLTSFQQFAAVTYTCIKGAQLPSQVSSLATRSVVILNDNIFQEINLLEQNMGIVTEVGSGVTLLKKGDRIVLPFNVADGRCRNCENGKTGESIYLHWRQYALTNSTAFCTGVNPGFAGGAYGYVAMGKYQGGQAQYLRVPYADFNALVLPPGTEHEADFALLADIFPTGWHGLELSGFQPGDSVAVFGAGPVGLMAAYSAVLRGASKVYVVDQVKERLDAARKIGCEGVDFTKSNPVEQIIELNGGEMVDRAVDAVGYQAVDKSGNKEQPNIVLDQLIQVTRPTGGLGIPGLYVPSVSPCSSHAFRPVRPKSH
jgi:threonine dehydrogenase-like Zn-dependent dehydrogenase